MAGSRPIVRKVDGHLGARRHNGESVSTWTDLVLDADKAQLHRFPIEWTSSEAYYDCMICLSHAIGLVGE